jgi:uncharacterized membrane protein
MPPTRETRFTSLRNAFLTGLLLLAPLVVTIWALRVVISILGGSITPFFIPYLPAGLSQLPSLVWDIVTTVLVLGFITVLGYLSRLFLGQYVGAAAERVIQHIPGIGGFYNSVKQFVETFGSHEQNQFSKVVLVEFPRAGAHTLGFLTNTSRGEPHHHLAGEQWAVFVPTCPSPMNGFFLFLPSSEIVELDMPVGDGMKVVISCGAVIPTWSDAQAAKVALKSEKAG